MDKINYLNIYTKEKKDYSGVAIIGAAIVIVTIVVYNIVANGVLFI